MRLALPCKGSLHNGKKNSCHNRQDGEAEKKKKEAVLARCALKNSLIFCKKNAVGTDEETPESKEEEEEENEGIVVVDCFCNYSAILRFRADSVRSHVTLRG